MNLPSLLASLLASLRAIDNLAAFSRHSRVSLATLKRVRAARPRWPRVETLVEIEKGLKTYRPPRK